MTTTLDSELTQADEIASTLAVLADELTASGYSSYDPGCLKIANARRALSNLTITQTGQITWEYRTCDGRHINPAQITGITLDILQPGHDNRATTLAHRDADIPLRNAVGQAAARHGLTVNPGIADTDTASGETYAELNITNPAAPHRGTIRITDDGALYWHCDTNPDHTEHPLTCTDIAATLTRALTAAYAPTDQQ